MTTKRELSHLSCDRAKPRLKPHSVFDHGGPYLLVKPTGGKLWRWAYRYEGKPRLMAFGKFPDVPLADARKHHADARQLLANGVDPMAMRKGGKEQKKVDRAAAEAEPVGLTFAKLARDWFEWWKVGRNPKYAANVEIRIEGDLIKQLGDKAPGNISRMELVARIKAVEARGARDIARRNLHFVRQMYEHGMNEGVLDQNTLNPAASIRPDDILKKAVEENFAHVPIGEVPELLRKMHDYDGGALTRIAMGLLSLTFLRTSELIGGLWAEIDWGCKMWRLPKERMKGPAGYKKPHIVPLAPQTLALLERLYSISGESDRLFPKDRGGPGTMSNNTILHALDAMGYKGRMTGHGWRSIASTYLHENGFNHEHIELQLAHSKQDKVSGAYNYANYLEPRAEMMCAWADALDKLRENGKAAKFVK